MRIINNIRMFLKNPQDDENRNTIRRKAGIIKVASAAGFGAGFFIGTVSLTGIKKHPIMCSAILLTSLIATAITHEIYTVSDNLEGSVSHDPNGHFMRTLNAKKFVHEITKNTWLIDRWFKSFLTRTIDENSSLNNP